MEYKDFVSNYLEDVLNFHGERFNDYNSSLQQQIQHLTFIAKMISTSGHLEMILKEHDVIKVGKCDNLFY